MSMSGKGKKIVKKGRTPLAFMSYARFVDEHDQGQLTKFCERLSGEVQVQTGETFPIFQDRKDIHWGQQWQERIDNSLDEVTFLIPILTPSFFKSQKCREELEKFLEREKLLGRSDLILPVYYVGYSLLDDEVKRQTDDLAQIIAERQFADWRDLRFEPFTNTQVRKTLAQMAIQIREALESRQPIQEEVPLEKTPRVDPPLTGEEARQASLPEASTGEAAGIRPGPSEKTEPPTHIVHPMHRGDFVTITAAIQGADPGDRILVYPGLYEEDLVLDKPLELVGVGGPDEVIVQTKDKHVLLFKTTMGRVANLSLHQMGGVNWYGVNISQGRLELEDCDITSQSLSCVAIHAAADPRLRRNRIHDAKGGGVHVFDNGQGTLEDNDIFGNAQAGVGIEEGGNPTLRRNRIHDGKAGGVFVYENGQGTLEDNDIFGNTLSGVEIMEASNLTIRRNRIHDGKQNGVYVHDNGRGTLEDNDIFGNAYSGVEIKTGGNPTLSRNRIHDSQQGGVYIYENGQGTLEDNDIFGNARAGVRIQEGGNPTLRGNRINKNGYEAVWIDKGGGGIIEDNDLRENGGGPWDISADSEAKVKRARNLE
ncbi:MAG: right-handed parallel beta-helix repeat-containing protein [Desulfobaccales bacterium]